MFLTATFKKYVCRFSTSLAWGSRELLHVKGFQRRRVVSSPSPHPLPATQIRTPPPARAAPALRRSPPTSSSPAERCGSRLRGLGYVTSGPYDSGFQNPRDEVRVCYCGDHQLWRPHRVCVGSRQSASEWGRRAGEAKLTALSSPLAAGTFTSNLGNLAPPARSERTGAAGLQRPPPLWWLLPTPG